MPLEPYAIMNPSGKHYKFLFDAEFDTNQIQVADRFVRDWALKHGWSIKRQKQRHLVNHNIFEISAWMT